MEYFEMVHKIQKFLDDNGFKCIDYSGKSDIYRQTDDNPKMDIKIQFIRHEDNL